MSVQLKWSNTYSVSVEEIDDQHRHLFEMINNFQESLDSADPTAPKKLLINLMEYALTHFKTEEKYFELFHYSGSKSHIEEHLEFETKVQEYFKKYQSRKVFNASTVLNFLKNWIINHVLICDKKYVGCFHEHGLR